MYLANSNTHSKRSSTLIAAVKDYPISKSCSVVNLYLQKEEHKSVKFVEYSVTGILIVFITWFQRSFCITHDSWCAKNSIKRIFTRNLFISLAFPMTIKHFLKVWDNWQKNVLTMSWDRNQIALQVPKLVRGYICSAADCRKRLLNF